MSANTALNKENKRITKNTALWRCKKYKSKCRFL